MIFYIYKAINELLKDKSEIIYDKYQREGYLIYKGEYYIYQPKVIRYEKIPMYYRYTPMEFKVKRFDLLKVIKKS